MLPAHHRLRTPDDFRAASRRGRRAAARTVVAHLLCPPTPQVVDVSPKRDDASAAAATAPEPARAGFVVSKAVGNAVVRNRVKRRLRHRVAEQLPRLAAGSLLVVRAQPSAAQADYASLAADLDRCLDRLLTPTETSAGRSAERGRR